MVAGTRHVRAAGRVCRVIHRAARIRRNSMQSHLPRLVVSPETLASIRETVDQTPEGFETGVTLFGVRGDSGFAALAAVGPGPKAVHTTVFHQPDANHLNREYERLLKQWPGFEWI